MSEIKVCGRPETVDARVAAEGERGPDGLGAMLPQDRLEAAAVWSS
jgi:hypothetical protein